MNRWVMRFMRRGLSPLIAQQLAIVVFSLVAMLISAGLLLVVYINGGLVHLLARAMAAQCLATGNCDLNSLMLQTEAPIIMAAQIAIMLARMASAQDTVSRQVQTELEDADLFAAVVGQEEKHGTGK